MKALILHIEGYGRNIPPVIKHVHIYFLQNGMNIEDADAFLKKMARQKWKTSKGKQCHNWKAYAFRWILKNKTTVKKSVKNHPSSLFT